MKLEQVVLWIIRMIVYCLKIMGLAPFSFRAADSTRNPRQGCIGTVRFSKAGLAYNLFLSILFTAMAMLVLQFRFSDNFQSNNIVSHLIYVIRVVTCAFSTCAIIILWTLRQRNAVCILNRLLEVKRQISSLKMQLPRGKMIAILIFHSIINIVMWVTFWITRIIVNPSNDNDVISIWKIITGHVIYWFTVEYVIAVGLIARYLESMNTNLLNLEKLSCYVSRSPFANDFLQAVISQTVSSHLAVLRSLIRIRVELLEISQDVNDFFSFPMLCCIVSTFSAVVRESHRFAVAPTTSLLPLSAFILFLSVNIYPIIVLSANVERTAKEVKLTALIIRKILASAVEQEVATELEQFSLLLLHDDFTFTACGFFPLDFTLINSIIGATLTYLIISLQSEARPDEKPVG